jgi:hypothetical protein
LVVDGIVGAGPWCVRLIRRNASGTGLKTDLEVRLGRGVRWRMLAKFRRETLRGFEQSAAVGTYLHSPVATSWIETRRAVENYAGGRGRGRVVGREGGEEEAEKGVLCREAVGKANPIVPRLIIHAI